MLKTSLIILFLTITVQSVRNVTIFKCCKSEEFLTNENKCARSMDKLAWTLKVFIPANQTFFTPKNTIPPHWQLTESIKPPCSRPALLTAHLGNYVFFKNGSLFVIEYNGKLIHPRDYCIDYSSVLFCLEEEPGRLSHVTVKKCCGKNAIFSETNHTCILLKDPSYGIDVGANKSLGFGFPVCDQHRIAFVGKLHEGEMQDNGSLWLPEHQMLLSSDNYCLEHVLENSGRSASVVTCQEYVLPVVTNQTSGSDLRLTIYPIGLALSAIFLAATLVAGALLPASHHVLHWRCQTNHVACLLVGDVLLCITHLAGNGISPVPCFWIAVFMHFLFLAAFFWLNTMCFNIWWTFRDLRPQSVEKSQERCRLRLYEAYAWGIPLIIAGTAAILDSIPNESGSDFLRPKFGESICWFNGSLEILTFFFGPVGILLLINLVLFALTARELTCGLWKREVVKSTSERAALGRVCMKLVVVMGITWIADVFSWFIGGPQEIWYLTDIINCLQGVFIFIVVGCQPQVYSAVKRLWCLRKHGENGTAGTTNHHSSSSQGMPSMGDTTTNNSVATTNTTKTQIPLETSC